MYFQCAQCGKLSDMVFRNHQGEFCGRQCYGKWARKSAKHHTLDLEMERLLSTVLEGEEPLFTFETGVGYALVGCEKSMVVIRGTRQAEKFDRETAQVRARKGMIGGTRQYYVDGLVKGKKRTLLLISQDDEHSLLSEVLKEYGKEPTIHL